jgi:hypothetical protein
MVVFENVRLVEQHDDTADETYVEMEVMACLYLRGKMC